VLIDVAGPAVHDVVERMDSSVVESVAWQAWLKSAELWLV
jgi:hypothetical protein